MPRGRRCAVRRDSDRDFSSFIIGDRRDHGLAHRDDQVAQHRVVELERVLELGERRRVALDVHQHVVRLVHLGDRVSELAPAPILEAVDPAAAGGDHRAVALDHRGHLLALVGMHDKYDFVMTHADSLLVDVGWANGRFGCDALPAASPSAAGEARNLIIIV